MVASAASNHLLADETERRGARDSRLNVFSQKILKRRSEINDQVASRAARPLPAGGVVGVDEQFKSGADEFVVALDLNLALALRLDCPIFVEDQVLKNSNKAGVVSEKSTNEELRKWLEGLNDDDLGRYKM